jgi:hypothetical protein
VGEVKRSISIRMAVSTLVVVHLVVAYWHGNAHEKLSVGLSSAQHLFVNGFVVLLPLIAVLIIWSPRQRTALCVFLASMLGSLIFGGYHHFIAVSSDNIACLPPGPAGWHWQFVASSAALAGLEIVAVLYGAYLLSGRRGQGFAGMPSA